jgi:hypothetical protein
MYSMKNGFPSSMQRAWNLLRGVRLACLSRQAT